MTRYRDIIFAVWLHSHKSHRSDKRPIIINNNNNNSLEFFYKSSFNIIIHRLIQTHKYIPQYIFFLQHLRYFSVKQMIRRLRCSSLFNLLPSSSARRNKKKINSPQNKSSSMKRDKSWRAKPAKITTTHDRQKRRWLRSHCEERNVKHKSVLRGKKKNRQSRRAHDWCARVLRPQVMQGNFLTGAETQEHKMQRKSQALNVKTITRGTKKPEKNNNHYNKLKSKDKSKRRNQTPPTDCGGGAS